MSKAVNFSVRGGDYQFWQWVKIRTRGSHTDWVDRLTFRCCRRAEHGPNPYPVREGQYGVLYRA